MTAPSRQTLALDIGGTKLAAAVVDDRGAVRGLRIIPTHREQGPDAVVARLFELGREALAASGLDSSGPGVSAVGISCGGPLDAEAGVVHRPLNLPDWDGVPLGPLARAEFGLPAHLVNDATAGMLAEHRFGAARGASDAIYLTISTGVGGGAVLGGRLHRGAAGNGGEFGHVMVRPGGRRCTCGRLGCLEAYASGTSIALRAQEAVGSGAPTRLSAFDPVRAEHVVAAMQAGDRVAAEIWDDTTAVLGQALTDLINTFEPEVVVLGGGVTGAGALLLDPVRRMVAERAMPPAAAAVRIELAALGQTACVIGAGIHAAERTPLHSMPGHTASERSASESSASEPSASESSTAELIEEPSHV
ncbi:ROK family protein [Naasia lichenicola]|uniref:ROK family protein n=1 Tax=Naasia lichenicola TaxID=2565933 RepID=A0A4S4FJF3_9MICO|nr:ROK family protein [Naasia lichenicola]THG29266.1 ROK family protein [Naasia lichenicola]